MKTGIEIIAEERQRQIEKEGWSDKNDDKYWDNQLVYAASTYALPEKGRVFDSHGMPQNWPFSKEWWKPAPYHRVRELAKAGALIAAEIDRLHRENKRKKDREVFEKLNAYYHKRTYWGSGEITQEEEDWVNNNTFKCVVTEETKNNGWPSDKEEVAKYLEAGKEYTVFDMSVGQSSGTVRLVEFPNRAFNTVNFKYYIAEK